MVDMDSRILNKFFSETINISSPLQDGATAMGDTVTPAPSSSAIGSDSALIPVQLNLSDTNLLTSLLNLYNSDT